MNTTNEIPPEELGSFKSNVKSWIELDMQIAELDKKSRELKKQKNKLLQPQITQFMVRYNISDLNTNNGKIRCSEQVRKKCLNKNNIRQNLSEILRDEGIVDKAMTKIWDERATVSSMVLKKVNK